MGSDWQTRSGRGDSDGRFGTAVFGIVLIAIGIAFFVAQSVNFDWARTGWPLFVIVPGVLMLLGGLAIRSEGGLGLAIPGAIVTTVGLVLAFQEATDAWASWAYMWALVAPGSVGVALVAHGLLHGNRDLVDGGLPTLATGLGLFVGFGLFFENVLDIDREASVNVMRDVMPIAAIVLGALIVLVNLLPRRKESIPGPTANSWTPGGEVEPPAAPQG
jgi:hypothetical protein